MCVKFKISHCKNSVDRTIIFSETPKIIDTFLLATAFSVRVSPIPNLTSNTGLNYLTEPA